MWAKGADGGQACTHACPRAVPGARERIVHMSSAWLFGAGGGGCAVGGASLGVSMQGARLGAEELGRAACEARQGGAWPPPWAWLESDVFTGRNHGQTGGVRRDLAVDAGRLPLLARVNERLTGVEKGVYAS